MLSFSGFQPVLFHLIWICALCAWPREICGIMTMPMQEGFMQADSIHRCVKIHGVAQFFGKPGKEKS